MIKLLKQGQKIKFDLKNGIKGTGKINGIANQGLPILEVGYIVKLDKKLNDDPYLYSHLLIYSNQLEKLE